MAKRRANGEGSIRKRKDGRWEGRYTAAYDPETGRRITKNVLGKTQAEVKEKLKAAQEATRGLDVKHSDEYTVGSWVQTWFELYSKPAIRPSTAEYYKRFINMRIIPALGDIKLNKLTSRDIQKFYNDLKDHGRVRKAQKEKMPGLSNAYVRGIHMMLHNCLDRAEKEHLIPRNPTEECIIPKIQRKEMKILHPDNISAYLKAADERGALPLFFLELTSGVRKGELVALLWSDLDIERKTLSVSKQATHGEGGEIKVTRPKTETSIRKISIPQETVDLLIQEHEKHPDNPYMFPSPKTGEMYYPDSVVNLHKKILKDAGLEHIRFHDLRHTFATLSLQNGVDVKTVSSMLGHYNAGFTLTTYAHATRQMQEDAAAKMGIFMTQTM
jgi:integrase